VIIPKLALRNLLGAGLRTWLNVVVLSFSFVAIIWTQGLYEGMNDQARRASVDAAWAVDSTGRRITIRSMFFPSRAPTPLSRIRCGP